MASSIASAYGIGAAQAAATPAPPAAGDDPAIDAKARALWNALTNGTLDRTTLTPDFSAQLTPTLLAQIRQGILAFGQLRSFTFAGKQRVQDVTTYRYALVFATGASHEWVVAIARDGKIAGSRLTR